MRVFCLASSVQGPPAVATCVNALNRLIQVRAVRILICDGEIPGHDTVKKNPADFREFRMNKTTL